MTKILKKQPRLIASTLSNLVYSSLQYIYLYQLTENLLANIINVFLKADPRGIEWRGRWEGGSGWGIHVNPWLTHVNVWQKPLQYCKVISLQLIKINEKKKANANTYFNSSSCWNSTCGWNRSLYWQSLTDFPVLFYFIFSFF